MGNHITYLLHSGWQCSSKYISEDKGQIAQGIFARLVVCFRCKVSNQNNVTEVMLSHNGSIIDDSLLKFG